MQLNYIAFAVPLFLAFIGWEYLYSRKKGRNFFQYAESVANLNVGIAERLLDVFTTGIFFYAFDYIQKHVGIFDIKAGWFTWVALFILTDLVWYWYHRLAHEINAFWAVHVVHHQSEDFNYTVSARITVLQAIVRSMFWAVLPLLGFPALMVSALLLVHGLYPFFIHTQALGKWGWFEKILVTPTHHGVHHASNPEYLDKNYGDVLIIWDKLFGTFAQAREEVPPVYGLTKPLKSHSFLWQHFHFPLELLVAVKRATGLKAKWKVLFGRPDDLDPRVRSVVERKFLNVQPHRKPTLTMRQYVTTQTIFSISLLFLVALFEHYFSGVMLFLLSAFILVSLINSGAILDQRRWIFYLEFIRVLLVMGAIAVTYKNSWTISCLLMTLFVMIWYFRPLQRIYMRLLYHG
jgi:sterol desaturase/sphingolipid hydroxylase (fatty acid hydroxylase superfamily)